MDSVEAEDVLVKRLVERIEAIRHSIGNEIAIELDKIRDYQLTAQHCEDILNALVMFKTDIRCMEDNFWYMTK